MSYNTLSHELTIDATSPDLNVLTTAYAMATYPNVTLRLKVGTLKTYGTASFEDYRCDTFVGSRVVRWHRTRASACDSSGGAGCKGTDGALEPVANLFDFASPAEYGNWPVTSSWTEINGLGCSGHLERAAVDYHHVSSISVGVTGNLIVASRNLNTVWSLAADGSTVQWMLSASIGGSAKIAGATVYAFERDADMFYAPHSVVQLSDGRLMMMDDGTGRPGCLEGDAADDQVSPAFVGCFSRAAIYSLDEAAGVAKLDWQFEIGADASSAQLDSGTADADQMTSVMTTGQYNWDGGSAYRLESGHVLVGVTSPYNGRGAGMRAYNANHSMTGWEVDEHAQVRAKLTIPHPYDQSKAKGGYRLLPWKSVGGESQDAPTSGC